MIKYIIGGLILLSTLIFGVQQTQILGAAPHVFTIGQGGTGLSTAPSYGQLLMGNNSSGYVLTATSSLGITGTADGTWSTTSASAWSLLGLGHSTTSTDYWKTQNNFYSTTSATYWADASTTIPKMYSTNTFTALNSFANSTSTLGTIDTFWSTLSNIATGIFTTLTTNGTASSTSLVVSDSYLTVGTKKLYTRWQGGGSLVQPTTTDEVFKPMINCLESGGNSVTIDKVDSILASTTFTGAENTQGLQWNISIAAFPASSSPMSLFTADVVTNSTSSMRTVTTGFSTATIPAGYCYFLDINAASTSQVGVFNVNLRGYEN